MVEIPPIFKGDLVRVYTLPSCPNCITLKDMLDKKGVVYKVVPMDSPEGVTELRVNGCFAMQAPVLQVGDRFYEY